MSDDAEAPSPFDRPQQPPLNVHKRLTRHHPNRLPETIGESCRPTTSFIVIKTLKKFPVQVFLYKKKLGKKIKKKYERPSRDARTAVAGSRAPHWLGLSTMRDYCQSRTVMGAALSARCTGYGGTKPPERQCIGLADSRLFDAGQVVRPDLPGDY